MRPKKVLEKELQDMKQQIEAIGANNAKLSELAAGKLKADETGSNILTLFKLVADQNTKNTLVMKEMLKRLERIEYDLTMPYEEQGEQAQAQEPAREAPISGLDASILQRIQIKGLTCADDIKAEMSYKGRNAASARLNKLYKQGLLERHQLGHKVFYKYDAGKAAKLHVIAPPQR